jgi:hypothetical protein
LLQLAVLAEHMRVAVEAPAVLAVIMVVVTVAPTLATQAVVAEVVEALAHG